MRTDPLTPRADRSARRTLQRNVIQAIRYEPVKPVPEAFVEAVRPHVAAQIWAMIELQRLTGMRSGEVAIMRSCDLDTS